MAGLLVAIGVMGILMSMAMPPWRTVTKREKEAELIFRGEQYMRAIDLYQRRFPGAYPTDLDLLVEQGFLRQAYPDPMTGEPFENPDAGLGRGRPGRDDSPGRNPRRRAAEPALGPRRACRVRLDRCGPRGPSRQNRSESVLVAFRRARRRRAGRHRRGRQPISRGVPPRVQRRHPLQRVALRPCAADSAARRCRRGGSGGGWRNRSRGGRPRRPRRRGGRTRHDRPLPSAGRRRLRRCRRPGPRTAIVTVRPRQAGGRLRVEGWPTSVPDATTHHSA